jgi:1-deoxy-D-xylulose-5-phosphate reductoisomerase
MNKGLEVIEAHFLFGIPYEQIRVVVHRESIVHGMVRFCDGSVLAHLQRPTMEGPIAFALSAPGRLDEPVGVIDWSTLGSLSFEEPDLEAFPCLRLAYDAGSRGGLAPAVLNAANEETVQSFLEGKLPFLGIAQINEKVLNECPSGTDITLESVEEAGIWARRRVRELLPVSL